MANAPGLGPGAARLAGSSPALRTSHPGRNFISPGISCFYALLDFWGLQKIFFLLCGSFRALSSPALRTRKNRRSFASPVFSDSMRCLIFVVTDQKKIGIVFIGTIKAIPSKVFERWGAGKNTFFKKFFPRKTILPPLFPSKSFHGIS